jgi:hypothetical protein
MEKDNDVRYTMFVLRKLIQNYKKIVDGDPKNREMINMETWIDTHCKDFDMFMSDAIINVDYHFIDPDVVKFTPEFLTRKSKMIVKYDKIIFIIFGNYHVITRKYRKPPITYDDILKCIFEIHPNAKICTLVSYKGIKSIVLQLE